MCVLLSNPVVCLMLLTAVKQLFLCLVVGFLGRSLRAGMIQLVLQGKDLNSGIMCGKKVIQQWCAFSIEEECKETL